MKLYDWYIGIVDLLILAGVWYEIYLMQTKRRQQQIKATVTRMLKRLNVRA